MVFVALDQSLFMFGVFESHWKQFAWQRASQGVVNCCDFAI
jgi:hypothetical protein